MDKKFKFIVGDKVDCIRAGEGFSNWKNATVVAVDPKMGAFPYSCTCDRYGREIGLFAESELDFAR